MRKLIIINGPSCAGKSTIIDKIFETKRDIFWLKFDAIKRFFIDYDSSSDKQKVTELFVVMGKNRIDKDEDILLEDHNSVSDYKNTEVLDYAKEKKYAVYEYNIEAPYEILLSRFRLRTSNPRPGIKINFSEEKHKNMYNKYLESKNLNIKTFDTSLQSAEKISKEILSDIL